MKIRVQSIDGIRSAQKPNSSEVIVDIFMTDGQMLDALLAFLERISAETWAEWQLEINKGEVRMVTCKHEFFQGHCVHCALAATAYRSKKY